MPPNQPPANTSLVVCYYTPLHGTAPHYTPPAPHHTHDTTSHAPHPTTLHGTTPAPQYTAPHYLHLPCLLQQQPGAPGGIASLPPPSSATPGGVFHQQQPASCSSATLSQQQPGAPGGIASLPHPSSATPGGVFHQQQPARSPVTTTTTPRGVVADVCTIVCA